MKLLASRSESKDIDDIRFLFKHLGIKTEEKATEILLTYFDENQILPKTQYIVRNILDETTMEPNNDIADPVERETTPPKP